MSSDYISISTRASRDVVLKDVEELNRKVREIYSDLNGYPWPSDEDGGQSRNVIGLAADGTLEFFEPDLTKLYAFAEVGHAWEEGGVSQVVAEHMTSGSLLLRFTQSGDSDVYDLLTPGKSERINIPVLLGFKKADLHGYWSEDEGL